MLVIIVGLFYSCSSENGNGKNLQSQAKSTQSSSSTAVADGPCSDPAYGQMDFWIGEWSGRSMTPDTSYESGWKIGKIQNSITKILDGCAVEGNFDGSMLDNPLIGKSSSVYNKREGIWHQSWVDNTGGYLAFYGIFDDDTRRFRKDVAREGNDLILQITFYNIEKDSFTWDCERSVDEGETWTLIWRIEYTRIM